MQGRHTVNGTHRATATEPVQGIEIRSLVSERNGHDLQVQGLRQHFESRVGQGVSGDYIAGLQKRHQDHRQPMLDAADDQHLLGRHPQPARPQVTSDRCPLMQTPGMRPGKVVGRKRDKKRLPVCKSHRKLRELLSETENGRGGWIRTNAWQDQNLLPYRLATPL